MTDHDPAAAHEDEAHTQPHMPPNSFIPIVLALSLGIVFVGFLSEVRDTVGPVMWVLGLAGVIGCCASWFISARREYAELPDEGGH